MTRKDYMTTLSQKLRRLPNEDYIKAMAYFEEYFDDAGLENEQQAIEDLGSPATAANELIMNLAVKNTQEPPKTVKSGLSAVWIGILGVCAAPIALPLALTIPILIFSLMIVVFALVLSFLITAVALGASGIFGIFLSCIVLFSSFADGVANLGYSLILLSTGFAAAFGGCIFCRWFLRKLSKTLGRITKGGKKNEANE